MTVAKKRAILLVAPMAPSGCSACLAENTLGAFVEGRAPSAEIAQIEEHIAGCAECRGVLAQLARAAPPLGVGASTTVPLAAPSEAGTRWLAPGTRIGRYEILERVGIGASGAVYAAHDPDLDRRVALKLLRPLAEQDALRVYNI